MQFEQYKNHCLWNVPIKRWPNVPNVSVCVCVHAWNVCLEFIIHLCLHNVTQRESLYVLYVCCALRMVCILLVWFKVSIGSVFSPVFLFCWTSRTTASHSLCFNFPYRKKIFQCALWLTSAWASCFMWKTYQKKKKFQ